MARTSLLASAAETLGPPLCPQKLLFSLGGSFLYYADHFKLYSGFCANHIKVQKVLERGTTHTHSLSVSASVLQK